jgi:hypothetical protein
MIEHAFECLEVELGGKYYTVSGDLQFEPEDNTFSYDYGEQTNLTHDPGTSFDILEVNIDEVYDEDSKEVRPVDLDGLDDAVKNAISCESMMITLNAHAESAKEEAAIARYESRMEDDK